MGNGLPCASVFIPGYDFKSPVQIETISLCVLFVDVDLARAFMLYGKVQQRLAVSFSLLVRMNKQRMFSYYPITVATIFLPPPRLRNSQR